MIGDFIVAPTHEPFFLHNSKFMVRPLWASKIIISQNAPPYDLKGI
jgi:hypothetical protein